MEREWLFDNEHRVFRETVRKWVTEELAPHADEWEKNREFPIELFQKAGKLGFFGRGLPEKYGGFGGDFRYPLIFFEEIARCNSGGVSAGLGLHGFVVLPAVNTFGSEEQKENYLIPGIQGEKIGALAVTEPDAGSDVAGIRTNAIRDENEFVINGSKVFITNGVRADFYIVACKTDPEKGHKGISEIIVDKGTPGFTVSRKLDKLGWWTSDTAELAFEDTRVPVSDLMGCENNGFNQIMHGFHPERLSMAVGSVASAQYCFDLTLRFVKERQTFGRSIDTFQVNRHKLADILMWIELARRLTYHAVWLYINGLECEKEIAMCKIFACEKAVEIAGICMEIYGDSGYMINNEVQRIWRDQRSQPIGGGTSEIQKEIIGKLLGF